MTVSFGKKLRECREAKGLSQSEFARQINAHHSIIGRYERDEVKPTIDVVKRLADTLETTVGYLLGESEDRNLLKDPAMLKRLNDISTFSNSEKEHILFAIDAMIKSVKMNSL
jgi:transcriptional regulator with XRE-family HTH domain